MTQEEFSAELGTRQQTISEWELGKYKPRGPSSRLLTILAERVGFKYGDSPEAEQPRQPTAQPETS
jgi:transcriptional regulator with XRE-family HTH domain